MKLSDETHSLQLNQYLFLKNCLLKRQIHRNLIVSRGKKNRDLERGREGRLTRWWKWEAWEWEVKKKERVRKRERERRMAEANSLNLNTFPIRCPWKFAIFAKLSFFCFALMCGSLRYLIIELCGKCEVRFVIWDCDWDFYFILVFAIALALWVWWWVSHSYLWEREWENVRERLLLIII